MGTGVGPRWVPLGRWGRGKACGCAVRLGLDSVIRCSGDATQLPTGGSGFGHFLEWYRVYTYISMHMYICVFKPMCRYICIFFFFKNVFVMDVYVYLPWFGCFPRLVLLDVGWLRLIGYLCALCLSLACLAVRNWPRPPRWPRCRCRRTSPPGYGWRSRRSISGCASSGGPTCTAPRCRARSSCTAISWGPPQPGIGPRGQSQKHA